MTRILVAHAFTSFGAAERLVLSFASLPSDEFQVTIASSPNTSGRLYEYASKQKIRCVRTHLEECVGSWNLLKQLRLVWNQIFLTFEYLKIIRKYSIDIIQVHSLSACVQMLPVRLLSKKPLFWVVQETLPIRRFPRFVFSALSLFVDKFLSVSRYVARNIRISGILRNKVEPIPVGILQHETASELDTIKKFKSVALVLYGNNPHVVDSLIQAIRLVYLEFEHVKFFILPSAGPAQSLSEKMKQSIPGLKLGRIGEISEISSMDLLIYTGVRVPFPFEALEAMAVGVPCVANHSGAVPEIVVDRKTGILTAPQDSRSLAKAVTELLSDEPLRAQMGREARKRALQRYRLEDQAFGMEQIYHESGLRKKQLTPY
ncbi:MAG: glycosyltransferase family 4 protein [Candidatus Omnitrophica bacterium]|nr:glycosyltransferase family 4 protein [Candidatus Omnitrophota bacterium]